MASSFEELPFGVGSREDRLLILVIFDTSRSMGDNLPDKAAETAMIWMYKFLSLEKVFWAFQNFVDCHQRTIL